VKPGVYNLGSGVATSFADVAEAVRTGLGLAKGDREVEYFDMPPAIRAFYQDFTQADMSMTANGLGWKPQTDAKAAVAMYARQLASDHR
jgi:nucleoside-diphosphate-sugar epimerase